MLINIYFDGLRLLLIFVNLKFTFIECGNKNNTNSTKYCQHVDYFRREVNNDNNYHLIKDNQKNFLKIAECNNHNELESIFQMKCDSNGKWIRTKTLKLHQTNQIKDICLNGINKTINYKTKNYYCFNDQFCNNRINGTKYTVDDTFGNSKNNCSSIESFSRKFDKYFDEYHFVIDYSSINVFVHFCDGKNNYKLSFGLMCNINNHWYKSSKPVFVFSNRNPKYHKVLYIVIISMNIMITQHMI